MNSNFYVLEGETIELHVEDYSPAVYLLRLRNQAQQWNIRWVKE